MLLKLSHRGYHDGYDWNDRDHHGVIHYGVIHYGVKKSG